MKTRNCLVVALLLLLGTSTSASGGEPVPAAGSIPLTDVTAPLLEMLKSKESAVRSAAGPVLVALVRKHPTAAQELVDGMAAERDADLLAEHERLLVPLAKESPATVSALIHLIREPESGCRVRNFGVKVLSQVGPAAATMEFVEALAETECPVPSALLRVMRSLGKDAAPILAAGFRHTNPTIREQATSAMTMLGRTDPAIQKLFDALQAEGPLVQQLRKGPPAKQKAAVTALAELARTTPGTATILVNSLRDITEKDVRAEAETRLISLGRESPEVVAALVAGVRDRGNYRLRGLALKVLPKVGANLNTKETIDALGDHYCPVPHIMRRILLLAGRDAVPVLEVARKNSNPEIRGVAEEILRELPKPSVAGVSAQP
ncbi:MAG: hypothetical protein U0792_01565 [Gemmataceae bacterium]